MDSFKETQQQIRVNWIGLTDVGQNLVLHKPIVHLNIELGLGYIDEEKCCRQVWDVNDRFSNFLSPSSKIGLRSFSFNISVCHQHLKNDVNIQIISP